MRLYAVAPLAVVAAILMLEDRAADVLLQDRRGNLGSVGGIAVRRCVARSSGVSG